MATQQLPVTMNPNPVLEMVLRTLVIPFTGPEQSTETEVEVRPDGGFTVRITVSTVPHWILKEGGPPCSAAAPS